MSELEARISSLSPAKRELLLQRLRAGGAKPAVEDPLLPTLVPDPAAAHEPYPLTDIQEAYWICRSGWFDLGTQGANAYFELLLWNFPPHYLDDLALALRKAIARHPQMRMVVAPDGTQRVLAEVPPYDFERFDLRGQDEAAVEERLEAGSLALRTCRAPLDRWPLFDMHAYLLDGDRLRLQMRFELILLDGVSRFVLFRDWFSFFREPETPLPEIGCTYRDLGLVWRDFGNSRAYRRAREFWQERLPELPPGVELPQVPAEPRMPSRFINLHVEEALDPAGWARLKARGHALGLTPTVLVMAAYADVLAVWNRQSSFTLPVYGKFNPPFHRDVDAVVGNFNTMTLFQFKRREETFRERAMRLARDIQEALEYQYYSGFRVLREWNRQHGPSSRIELGVMFDSIIELSHPRYTELITRDLGREIGGRYVGHAGLYVPAFSMITMVVEVAGALQTRWQVVEDLFPAGLVEALCAAHLLRLRWLAEDEAGWDAPWSEVVARLGGKIEPAPPVAHALPEGDPFDFVVAQLGRLARHLPEGAAARHLGRELCFRELAAGANAAAAALRAAGIPPGASVAVAPGRLSVAAWLAALAQGAVPFLVAAERPREEREALLAEVRPEAWLAAGGAGLELAPPGVRVVAFDPEADAPALVATAGVPHSLWVAATDPGRDRASAERHGLTRLLATVFELAGKLELKPGETFLTSAAPDTEEGLANALLALVAAACSAPFTLREESFRAAQPSQDAAAVLHTRGPALAQLLAWQDSTPWSGLRRVALSHGRLPRAAAARLLDLAPDADLLTLTAGEHAPLGTAVSGPLPVAELAARGAGFLAGTPIGSYQAVVRNGDGHLCPSPVVAEVWLRDGAAGDAWRATGELGRLLPAGGIEWLGPPAEAEVHRAGHRFELAAVAAAAEALPGIELAAVRAVVGGSGRTELELVALSAPGGAPNAEELLAHLERDLPYYMVPERAAVLSSLPWTADARLAATAFAAAQPARDSAAPELSSEEVAEVARLWQRQLETVETAPGDDFFESGGSSLTLVKLFASLEARFGPLPGLWSFFLAPTFERLTHLIAERRVS